MELRNLKKIITEKATSIAGCVAAAAEIDKYAESGKISRKKIAVLSNFTLNGIAEALKTNAFLNNIFIDVYLGNYGQWQQELMSNNLYDFAPEIIFVILDRFGIDSDIYNSYHLMPEEEIESYFKNYLAEIYKLVDAAKEKTKAKIVVSNIVDFWSNILGIAEGRAKNSLRRYIKRANLSLEQKYANDHQVLVFDFDGWLGYRGKEQNMYAKFFFLADMRLNPEIMPALAKELCAYLIAVFGKSKKCLVLDLDNTLWGGIIGEDGLSGISLAPHGAGQEFYLFQKTILAFHRRGIILAINSKNNWEDAMEVFEKHPHMILKR